MDFAYSNQEISITFTKNLQINFLTSIPILLSSEYILAITFAVASGLFLKAIRRIFIQFTLFFFIIFSIWEIIFK